MFSTTGVADELEAVLAHELARVKNRDVAVMTVVYPLPTLTYVVATVRTPSSGRCSSRSAVFGPATTTLARSPQSRS